MGSHSGDGSAERSGQNHLGEPVGDLLQTAGDLDVAGGVQAQQRGQQVGRMGPRVTDCHRLGRQHFVDNQAAAREFDQIELVAGQRSGGRNQLHRGSIAAGHNQPSIGSKARFLATRCYFDSHVGRVVITHGLRATGGSAAGKETFIVGDVGDHAHRKGGFFPLGDQQRIAANLQDDFDTGQRISRNGRPQIERFGGLRGTGHARDNGHNYSGHSAAGGRRWATAGRRPGRQAGIPIVKFRRCGHVECHLLHETRDWRSLLGREWSMRYIDFSAGSN